MGATEGTNESTRDNYHFYTPQFRPNTLDRHTTPGPQILAYSPNISDSQLILDNDEK